eukprot:4911182-Alexandrium_andersonii.AAC.1
MIRRKRGVDHQLRGVVCCRLLNLSHPSRRARGVPCRMHKTSLSATAQPRCSRARSCTPRTAPGVSK